MSTLLEVALSPHHTISWLYRKENWDMARSTDLHFSTANIGWVEALPKITIDSLDNEDTFLHSSPARVGFPILLSTSICLTYRVLPNHEPIFIQLSHCIFDLLVGVVVVSS